MKKLGLFSVCFVLAAVGSAQAQEQASAASAAVSAPVAVAKASPYNFGDFRSTTLATKAWKALSDKNLEAVLVYTNKCLELYGEKARVMQAGLQAYPAGDDQKIFSFWALNDSATCLYIQGEAYRQAGKADDARKAFDRVVKEFTFGQAYDPAHKTFWKPADAAKEKIEMISKGLNLDFGDMSSSYIAGKAWEALAKKDLNSVLAYVNKNLELYGPKAREMQASLKEFAWESQEKIFSFWALNDVGTSMFVLGSAYRNAGKNAEALAAFKQLVNDYGFSQCWDPQGWFWKPAEAAQQQIIELESAK
ncbi:MAG: tetratricopeptide repeat protein [Candidatus Omnitrophica bacterium]|nr:tetratricopeptide repeat protein [Candidatus Omnitrophota bacterium]